MNETTAFLRRVLELNGWAFLLVQLQAFLALAWGWIPAEVWADVAKFVAGAFILGEGVRGIAATAGQAITERARIAAGAPPGTPGA